MIPSDTLTHWGRVTHICVSKLTTIGSDNGLSPGRRQAIIWTNDRILLIRTLGKNLREILSEIHSFSFKKMHLKISSAKWRLFRLGLSDKGDNHCWHYKTKFIKYPKEHGWQIRETFHRVDIFFDLTIFCITWKHYPLRLFLCGKYDLVLQTKTIRYVLYPFPSVVTI